MVAQIVSSVIFLHRQAEVLGDARLGCPARERKH